MLNAAVAVALVFMTTFAGASPALEPEVSTLCSGASSGVRACPIDQLTVSDTQTVSGAAVPAGEANPAGGTPRQLVTAAPLSAEEVAAQERLAAEVERRAEVRRVRCEEGIEGQLQGVMAAYCESIAAPEEAASDASGPAAPASRPITVTDLVSFQPDAGELVSEPSGWAAVGTPSNFYATSEMHAQNGDLFGALVTVRWVPVGYSFDYGDGHTAITESPGRAWRDGEEWTEMVSSHVFETRDDVTVTVSTEFAADVNAGGGWVRVPGTLTVDAPSEFIKVFEVKTVLTKDDCLAQPGAPGCP